MGHDGAVPGDPPSPGGADGVRVVLGVGASRGCPPDELRDLAAACLAEAGLPRSAVAAVASADVKADEPAVLALAADLGVPTRFLAADVLATVEVPTPSATVARHVGTPSVAEAAALLVAGGAHRTEAPEPGPDVHPTPAAECRGSAGRRLPSRAQAPLLVPKRRSAHATCAVARAVPAADSPAPAADHPATSAAAAPGANPSPAPAEVPAP